MYSPPTGWFQRTIDLSAHSGGFADVAFHFMASSTTNLAGWYIDDISVTE
jgi:kynurenine formamidase